MDQGTTTYCTTKGVFAGASINMATMEYGGKQNESFYGKEVKPLDILYKAGAVELPKDSQVRWKQ
jgi:lipid-binding SYLF domain-containing protein